MEPLISRVPIMVVEGNHEIEDQVRNKTFSSYSSRFAFPSQESGSSNTFYYSFNAGGIHFIMLGGYIDYNKTGEQYRWLEHDLAEVDRSMTRWHPPWYNSYKSRYREAKCMKQVCWLSIINNFLRSCPGFCLTSTRRYLSVMHMQIV